MFKEWFNNTLKNNTIKCKKFATIVSGQKNKSVLENCGHLKTALFIRFLAM